MSSKMNSDGSPPLANVASEIEKRRCDLIDRHRHLRDKVATMERSIPALMTCNMWRMANDGRDCRDTPYRIVRQIVDKLSPQPDPADRLVAELKDTVNDLRLETAQLHDKIIDADVKLDETTMELESLELANKEMEEKLVGLRNRVQRHSTPSLHSIHSEDLICLKKIRQLAEEELNLKSCVKELEDKETMYRRQMKQLVPCEKFQRNSGKTMARVQNSIGNDRELCRSSQIHKRNVNTIKKHYTSKGNGQKIYCSCPITLNTYEETSMKSFQACCSWKLYENLCPPLSRYTPLDSRAPYSTTKHKANCCRASCESCQPIPPATFKSGLPSTLNAYRESSLDAISKTDVSPSLKHPTHSFVPCNPGETCNACETSLTCEQIDSCRCKCEEKNTYELSNALCNCSAPSLDPTARASMASETQRSGPEVNDDISDEEFCDCCSCGEDSEESM